MDFLTSHFSFIVEGPSSPALNDSSFNTMTISIQPPDQATGTTDALLVHRLAYENVILYFYRI